MVYPINIPLNHYKIPLNHYKIPLNHYKIPLNHYKIPLNRLPIRWKWPCCRSEGSRATRDFLQPVAPEQRGMCMKSIGVTYVYACIPMCICMYILKIIYICIVIQSGCYIFSWLVGGLNLVSIVFVCVACVLISLEQVDPHKMGDWGHSGCVHRYNAVLNSFYYGGGLDVWTWKMLWKWYEMRYEMRYTWIFIGYKFLFRADFGLISVHFL